MDIDEGHAAGEIRDAVSDARLQRGLAKLAMLDQRRMHRMRMMMRWNFRSNWCDLCHSLPLVPTN